MTGLRAWVDGRLVAAADAVVSAYDRGFRTGEGVFETLRAYGGHVFRLADHLRRAEQGAAALGFDPGPRGELAAAVRRTADANLEVLGGADSAVRLTVSPGRIDPAAPFPGELAGGPTVVVTSHGLALSERLHRDGVTAVCVARARELPRVKSISYVAATQARRQAAGAGADEALLTTRDGHVLEGASSNVFAVTDGTLVTPPVDAGILAGVTRQVVLEVARGAGLTVEQRPLARGELAGADEAVITSTTREVVPLVAVDGDPIGDGTPGPAARRLLSAYRDEVAAERAAAGD